MQSVVLLASLALLLLYVPHATAAVTSCIVGTAKNETIYFKTKVACAAPSNVWCKREQLTDKSMLYSCEENCTSSTTTFCCNKADNCNTADAGGSVKKCYWGGGLKGAIVRWKSPCVPGFNKFCERRENKGGSVGYTCAKTCTPNTKTYPKIFCCQEDLCNSAGLARVSTLGALLLAIAYLLM